MRIYSQSEHEGVIHPDVNCWTPPKGAGASGFKLICVNYQLVKTALPRPKKSVWISASQDLPWRMIMYYVRIRREIIVEDKSSDPSPLIPPPFMMSMTSCCLIPSLFGGNVEKELS